MSGAYGSRNRTITICFDAPSLSMAAAIYSRRLNEQICLCRIRVGNVFLPFELFATWGSTVDFTIISFCGRCSCAQHSRAGLTTSSNLGPIDLSVPLVCQSDVCPSPSFLLLSSGSQSLVYRDLPLGHFLTSVLLCVSVYSSSSSP